MNSSRILRRGLISLLAICYYFAVVYLTGLSMRVTTMSQFFGHALIYAAGVGLFSSVLFIAQRSSSRKKEEELIAEAVGQIQDHHRKGNS